MPVKAKAKASEKAAKAVNKASPSKAADEEHKSPIKKDRKETPTTEEKMTDEEASI